MKPSSTIGKEQFLQLSKTGSDLNLSFSSQEVLNGIIMALDGMNRKLLLMPSHDPMAAPAVILLSEARNILIKKSYSGIPANGLKSKSVEAFNDNIDLVFEMADKETIEVSFFDSAVNHVSERAKLEKKRATGSNYYQS